MSVGSLIWSFCSPLLKCRVPTINVTAVRYLERKPFIRRYGYENPLMEEGLLPRLKDGKPLITKPRFKVKNSWAEKRALFGQNDYIDILGDGKIHPTRTMSDVPLWLRGFQGNEYQMLLKKKKTFYHYKWIRPKAFNDMNKRIKYLYNFLNRHTRTS